MERINDLLFLVINASAHPPVPVLTTALFLANWLVPLAVLLFITLWVRTSTNARGSLLTATVVMLIGLGVNQLLGAIYFHPRPFMIGLGHQYLPHLPDNSFPSDHATFLWSLGFALLILGHLRRWGAVLVLAGLAIAWARVYVGVHFPFDMLGSLIVSLVVAGFARILSGPLLKWVLMPCNSLYIRLIVALHLPPVLFPR
ncbi:MAG TPA: phosphatase PAP2 family protein [Halothiobacillus sp.]|nr:phosphatase PAP2 family protein [Halothiobacillus sp.]